MDQVLLWIIAVLSAWCVYFLKSIHGDFKNIVQRVQNLEISDARQDEQIKEVKERVTHL